MVSDEFLRAKVVITCYNCKNWHRNGRYIEVKRCYRIDRKHKLLVSRVVKPSSKRSSQRNSGDWKRDSDEKQSSNHNYLHETNIAIDKITIEIDDLPATHGDFPWLCLPAHQRFHVPVLQPLSDHFEIASGLRSGDVCKSLPTSCQGPLLWAQNDRGMTNKEWR